MTRKRKRKTPPKAKKSHKRRKGRGKVDGAPLHPSALPLNLIESSDGETVSEKSRSSLVPVQRPIGTGQLSSSREESSVEVYAGGHSWLRVDSTPIEATIGEDEDVDVDETANSDMFVPHVDSVTGRSWPDFCVALLQKINQPMLCVSLAPFAVLIGWIVEVVWTQQTPADDPRHAFINALFWASPFLVVALISCLQLGWTKFSREDSSENA